MRKQSTLALVALILMSIVAMPFCSASAEKYTYITTTPTGYSNASDVEYVTIDGTVVNWGARGENCTFLTTYAESYYINDCSWDVLSSFAGGTNTSDAPNSELYVILQTIMEDHHTNKQGYQDTRPFYRYTDCVSNDHSLISSFYTGNTVASQWTGSTYNREHVWPKSKCLYNNKTNDSADIMMLRATITSENSNRGNTAYGESGSYYDPGVSVRGDCARMVLYGYVRWGNTSKMWGSSGVIESLDVLLKWMEEDPVDTWEMGRNDAVQSITGVRNVFVDYPELAWLLFGQKVPEDYTTPSGSEANKPCPHTNTQSRNEKEATCVEDGYSGDTICTDCGVQIAQGEGIPATGEHKFSPWITVPGGGEESRWCEVCGYEEARALPDCAHEDTELTGEKAHTCTEDGYSGDILCRDCGCYVSVGEVIPATGHQHTEVRGQKEAACTADGHTGYTYCTDCGKIVEEGEAIRATGHQSIMEEPGKSATCAEDGYTGNKRCRDCSEVVEPGSVIPATADHTLSPWITVPGGGKESRFCEVCGYEESHEVNEDPSPTPWGWVIAVAVGVVSICGLVVLLIVRKKQAK